MASDDVPSRECHNTVNEGELIIFPGRHGEHLHNKDVESPAAAERRRGSQLWCFSVLLKGAATGAKWLKDGGGHRRPFVSVAVRNT